MWCRGKMRHPNQSGNGNNDGSFKTLSLFLLEKHARPNTNSWKWLKQGKKSFRLFNDVKAIKRIYIHFVISILVNAT